MAKPNIAGGSLFTDAKFTITGDKPQTIRVTTSPAENFTIVRTDVGRVIVYRNVNFESYGSLTLKPGTYELSCAGRGALGLMSNKVCIEYPVAQEAPPASTEPREEVLLPPREVVVATAPDGSKLIRAPTAGRYSSNLASGHLFVAVGETLADRWLHRLPGGTTVPLFLSADPAHLATCTHLGVDAQGYGVTHITGESPGQGWLVLTGGSRFQLVVFAAEAEPTKGWKSTWFRTIKGKVTYRGEPIEGASILLLHEYFCLPGRCDDPPESLPRTWISGKQFDRPDWKTNELGFFTIKTRELFAGRYKIRVVKMAEADKGQNFGSNMWSKNEPRFTVMPDKPATLGPFEIEMETMREKYPGMALP